MGLVLAERQEGDLKLEVDGFVIYYAPLLHPLLDGITIDYRYNYWGEPEFFIYGLNSCG